ncbi:AtpZ/AtpI family protein [Falsiroseomonas sp. CW058]|uniref:AtpZ/AtpI family protein n=1 Tax=Falsiroseomonas sp. CW058 TaxID=3388664 RepID=UPI003D31AB6A
MAEQDGFEKRLRQARARQGMDPKPGGSGQLPQGGWGLGFRAGTEVVSALVVGIGVGWFLDRWLGTWPWLFLVFFVLGSAAGVMNVYRLFSPRRSEPPEAPGSTPPR